MDLSEHDIAAYYRNRVPKLRQKGGEWRGPCPVHEGEDDNFSVNARTGQAYCHSQCQRGWGLVGLEMELTGKTLQESLRSIRELVGAIPHNGNGTRTTGPKLSSKSVPDYIEVARYTYTDQNGQPLFVVVRKEAFHDEERKKEFYQGHHDEHGKWVANIKDVARVPYRLPKILAAETVIFVEGEKDVHTLEDLGYVATTSPMGAGRWCDEYAQHFKGKDVVILPDNDAEGRKHAAQVRASLILVAKSIRILELPGLPPKGDVTDWFAAGHSQEEFDRLLATPAQPAETAVNDGAGPTVNEFRIDRQGIHALLGKNREYAWIGSSLEVVAETRDAYDWNAGKLVSFTDRSGVQREAVIADFKLVSDGDGALEPLVEQGYFLDRSRAAKDSLKKFIYVASPKRRVRTVPELGWFRESFVQPEQVTNGDTVEEIMFWVDGQLRHKYHQSGTVDEWRAKVAAMCSGNPRLQLALCAAFAGPLLRPLRAESAGFHFFGGTSTGKTTALLAAGSVWGGGDANGFIESWRATANALELRGRLHNDALLCLDEIGECAPKELDAAVYFLINGISKGRANKQVTTRPQFVHRTICLSSGERTLYDMLTSGGITPKGGQELRLIEISADADAGMGIVENLNGRLNSASFVRELQNNARAYHGTAINSYLKQLVAEKTRCVEYAREIRDEFTQNWEGRSGVAAEVSRVASKFGLVGAAGELATKFGITGWQPGAALDAIEASFEGWIESRGGTGPIELLRGIEEVRIWLRRYGSDRCVDLKEPDRVVKDKAGFRKRVLGGPGGPWFDHFLDPNIFKNEICRGRDHKAIYNELVRRGMAVAGDGDHQFPKRVGGQRMAVIRPSIFLEGKAPEEDAGESGECGEDRVM